MKRLAQAFLFSVLLGVVAVGLPGEAQAQPYTWSTVTVDAAGDVGQYTSIAVDANGDPMISYHDDTNGDLRFAVCDLSASTTGNCAQPGDWSTAMVDSAGTIGEDTSIAVDANGDPVISYLHRSSRDLRFAICDLSASANGNCDQTADWSTLTVDSGVDVGWDTSIAVDANGDPVISYYDWGNDHLKFAICDLSASANGNCDQAGDWSLVTVNAAGNGGWHTSIAVNTNGDPMISYHDDTNGDLSFAICDISASANGNCDQTADWTTVAVDAVHLWAAATSIAVDANGDPMISYYDGTNEDLKFAICDLSASGNGNCDQPSDWSKATVDSLGNLGLYPSIGVGTTGNPMISQFNNTSWDLKFAICDLSASANGNCDQTADWSTLTVDAAGEVGTHTSIAVAGDGDPMISYFDNTNADLKFATGSFPWPVGGIAELPDVSDSSGRNYVALAGLAAAAVVALSAGVWYARRRWLA